VYPVSATPDPTCPRSLSPQQYASPVRVSAQLWYCPASIAASARRPETRTGAGVICDSSSVRFPLPSWPK
jgi:hypothetical protein